MRFTYDVVTTNQAVNVLNEALRADPRAINSLFIAHREVCNKALANHSTVQVRQDSENGFSVGVMGLINGILGVDEHGNGPIAVLIDDKGAITGFALRSKV